MQPLCLGEDIHNCCITLASVISWHGSEGSSHKFCMHSNTTDVFYLFGLDLIAVKVPAVCNQQGLLEQTARGLLTGYN